MNKLYSLLIGTVTVPAEYAWYSKRTEEIPVTEKMSKIIELIITDVPVARLALYVSTVCNLVLSTQYGAEIKKLDPNNTYFPVTRWPDADHSDTNYGMADLIQPIDKYRGLMSYLAKDISDRLDSNSWFDLMGAACLQLLREII